MAALLSKHCLLILALFSDPNGKIRSEELFFLEGLPPVTFGVRRIINEMTKLMEKVVACGVFLQNNRSVFRAGKRSVILFPSNVLSQIIIRKNEEFERSFWQYVYFGSVRLKFIARKNSPRKIFLFFASLKKKSGVGDDAISDDPIDK